MKHIMHGWHVNRAPALDEIVVTENRHVVASRPLPREINDDPEAWDRALAHLGYTRTDDWGPTDGGQRCAVAPL